MEVEVPLPKNSRKRRRSPFEDGASQHNGQTSLAALSTFMDGDVRAQYVRQPKRLRRDKDVPDYHAPIERHVLEHMARGNPLNRKNLKKESKRARRAHQLAERKAHGEEMKLDSNELEFTFMA